MNIEKIQEIIQKEEVLVGEVIKTEFDKELEKRILVVETKEYGKGIIIEDEVDLSSNQSLVEFVGRKIKFQVLEYDEGYELMICSRKAFLKKMQLKVLEELKEEDIIEARIVNILNYGAYVEYKGISGLIKDVDFSSDYTSIKDVCSVGEVLAVKVKSISPKGKLTFEAAEKYVNENKIPITAFEPNQVVVGYVRSIKPFGTFVSIAQGIDALSPVPEDFEIEEGMKVRFRTTVVDCEKERVRGKILSVVFDDDY